MASLFIGIPVGGKTAVEQSPLEIESETFWTKSAQRNCYTSLEDCLWKKEVVTKILSPIRTAVKSIRLLH